MRITDPNVEKPAWKRTETAETAEAEGTGTGAGSRGGVRPAARVVVAVGVAAVGLLTLCRLRGRRRTAAVDSGE